MKNILLICIFFILLSCSTVREGFQNNKKNNSDEFLVEKKSPLVMPPDFDKLPVPGTKNENEEFTQNSLKELIQDNNNSNTNSNASRNFQESLLDKIKKN
tara:strand:- start:347 stop:646 length:300 start_codon:yes stop_codon:yes gene_type:complete